MKNVIVYLCIGLICAFGLLILTRPGECAPRCPGGVCVVPGTVQAPATVPHWQTQPRDEKGRWIKDDAVVIPDAAAVEPTTERPRILLRIRDRAPVRRLVDRLTPRR